MSNLTDLMAQHEAVLRQAAELERQLQEVRRNQRNEAIAKIKAIMAEHNLTPADLGGIKRSPTAAAGERKTVAAKYRNSETGETWSGRGLKPRWLQNALAAGKSLEDFAIAGQK